MNGPTYDQETQLRVEDAYRRAGLTRRCANREHVEPIVWRESTRTPVAPTPEEIHLMAPAAYAWAVEGNENFEAEVAKHIAAGEDSESSRAAVKAEAEWHVAKMLDQMRAEDPAKAREFVKFVRRMSAEFGVPPPYPFG